MQVWEKPNFQSLIIAIDSFYQIYPIQNVERISFAAIRLAFTNKQNCLFALRKHFIDDFLMAKLNVLKSTMK